VQKQSPAHTAAPKAGALRLKHRDLSWLSFNHRVLQEAADPLVPLFDRIKFLAIFSSNIDEFFRVRVASIRALVRLGKRSRKTLGIDPAALLSRIHRVVDRQQAEFGAVYNGIRKDLARTGIQIITERELDVDQARFARLFFRREVRALLIPQFIDEDRRQLFLENRHLYLVVELLLKSPLVQEHKGRAAGVEPQHVILEIPSHRVPRFVTLPSTDGKVRVAFLDDIIRLCLDEIFPNHDILGAHAVKLTRDAELHIDDEFAGDLREKVRQALALRNAGVPSRFLYDGSMPPGTLRLLSKVLKLSREDLVRGARYHNFHDFLSFPNPHPGEQEYPPMPALSRGPLETAGGIHAAVERGDILLYYPYHSYEPVISLLTEAADDPRTRSIHITLYRLARPSQVLEQLIRAAQRGIDVTAFFEVKARFDEEANLRWADDLERAGGRILYSIPGLKVHAKLCLVTRGEDQPKLAYLSTGNFNEKAARIYCDAGLMTSDPAVTGDVAAVFDVLLRRERCESFSRLLVAPFTMREQFLELLDGERANARAGRPAFVVAKMNSLEDPGMIRALYEAAASGVRISLIIRGICCLQPGVKGPSSSIRVISIVDRYLEHARIFWFHHGGEDLLFLSSADWMTRNLNRRIEVAFPVQDSAIQEELKEILRLQLADTVKARVIGGQQDNTARNRKGPEGLRSQEAIYQYLVTRDAKTHERAEVR